MKILFFSQYFWPENFLINDLATELNKKNTIKVITGYPNYPKGKLFKGYKNYLKSREWFHNIEIIRSIVIPRKKGTKLNLIINYLSFAFFSFFRIIFLKNKKTYNLCFVYAPSPLISLFSIFFLKKRFNFKIYLWLQDLWPLVINNKTNNFLIKKIIYILCRYIYNKSDIILIQSLDYKDYLIKEFQLHENKIVFCPNWSQNKYRVKYNSSQKNKFNIIYSGNIGYSQNLSILINICKNLEFSNFEFHLYGEGRYKKQLQKDILSNKINNIILHTHVSLEILLQKVKECDALFLSLASEYSHTIPAKFQFYLSLGLPILAHVDGYLYDLINKKNIGLAAKSNNLSDLEDILIKFSKYNQKEKSIIANNAFKLYVNNFSKEKIINKINKLINEENYY